MKKNIALRDLTGLRRLRELKKFRAHVTASLLFAAPLFLDEHNLESICQMKTFREQLLYGLLAATDDAAIRASKPKKARGGRA